jgi:hypothetical protein
MKHVCAVVLLLSFVGCGGGNSSSSLVAGPSATPTTDTFSGTVAVGGYDFKPFTVGVSNGQVNVDLTAAGPPPTIFMGVGVGTPSGSDCTLLSGASVVAQAGSTAQLSGTASAGSYCVMVFDAGNQTADVSYTVTVSHY